MGAFVLLILAFSPLPSFGDSGREIKELEDKVTLLEKNQAELYHSLEERKSSGLMEKITENISLGGLIEVEASFEDNEESGEDTSDIVLATVELGIDAEINENVTGHVLLLYEEDEESNHLIVDEGTITISSGAGFSLTAGKMYVPFGVFNSHFISDPLTLELGETNETAIMATYGNEMFEVSLGVFNGDMDEGTGDNKINDIFASLTLSPAENITIGTSYISNIADSDAAWEDATGTALANVSDDVAGYSAFLSVSFGALSVEAEYLAAADEFTATEVATTANGLLAGDEPSTYNLEVAYAVSETLEVAARLEGSDDLVDHPEKQYGVAASYGIYENTTLAVEYLKGEFKSGKERDLITAQLALKF